MHKTVKFSLLMLLFLLVTNVYAVHLKSEAQYVAWSTDVRTTNFAEFAQRVAQREDQLIADAYNSLASPTFWVWKTIVTKREIYRGTCLDGTTWSWTIFKAQSVPEQNSWLEMFAGGDDIDASLANVQTGIGVIFGPGSAQTAYLKCAGRRPATRLEKLLSDTTGGNVGSTSNPAILTFEGKVGTRDVAHMLVPATPLDP